MNSIKGVFAGLVLLIGFLPATAGTPVVDKKALTADGAKRGVPAAIVKARRVNAANSFGAGKPADSASSRAIFFETAQVAAALAEVRKDGHVTLFDGTVGR